MGANIISQPLPEPTKDEKDLLVLFDDFDVLYSQRKDNHVTGDQWEDLGIRFTAELGSIGQNLTKHWDDLDTEIMPAWNSYSSSCDVGLNYFFRASLIMGECFLFASQTFFQADDSRFLLNYEKGISVLDQIIVAAEFLEPQNPNQEKKLEQLPDFLTNYEFIQNDHEGEVNHALKLNPYAGKETIGTGLSNKGVQGIGILEARKVTANPEDYISTPRLIQLISKDVGLLIPTKQIHTTTTSRELLSHFCPWGVDLYFLLKESGLTEDLDFRILHPFSKYDPLLANEVLSDYEEFPDALVGGPIDTYKHVPPLMSEQVLEKHQVPKHIYDEVKRIIGEDGEGHLDLEEERPIEWEWVEDEPTFTIWYTSPDVLRWRAKDYLKLWFTVIKIVTSPTAFGLDETLSLAVNAIKEISGDHSGYYVTAKVAFEGRDMGFFTKDFITKGQWLSPSSILQKIASASFQAADKQILQDRFEGIDPAYLSMGLSYNGASIPPIILRGEVLGFEKVKNDEYPRTVKAVRFYLFYPENVANKGPFQGYNLSTSHYDTEGVTVISELHRAPQYLSEQSSFRNDNTNSESVRKICWNKLPRKSNAVERIFSEFDGNTRSGALLGPIDPLASFEIISDYTPKTQRISFTLHRETQRLLASNRGLVEVELWTNDEIKYLINELPTGIQVEQFHIRLTNGKREAEPNYRSESWVSLYSPYDRSMTFPVEVVPIKTYYRLRFKVNGKYVPAEYTVIVDKGGVHTRVISGTRSVPELGSVYLDYKPSLTIPFAEIRKEHLVPGSNRAVRMTE